jgi:AcrR family transcriptional regulator
MKEIETPEIGYPAARAAETTLLPPRERILEVAYALFSRRGVRGVGIDEVVERAGVAKATLYRHFPTKEHLVLAFLDLRERRFVREFVEVEARQRAATPEAQLLAIFDAYDEWFRHEDFEACSFVNVLLELGAEDPAGRASIAHLETLNGVIRGLAEEAGLNDIDAFARSWHILMKGSIVAAAEGDLQAAQRAKAMGQRLIEEHRKRVLRVADARRIERADVMDGERRSRQPSH